MMDQTILVVEDEDDIRELISYNLERRGYRVVQAADGESALACMAEQSPTLVVLDLMLPRLDGVEVCRRLKADAATCHVPVIMVTARTEESDVVLGLGVGADDYVTKPFSPLELAARVEAVLRRGPLRRGGSDDGKRLGNGPVVLDRDRHEVLVEGGAVRFTAAEFRLLHHLLLNRGRVFSRAALIPRVSGEDAVVTERTIDVHVRAIRQKLGDHRDMVETVRGVGYRCRDLSSDAT